MAFICFAFLLLTSVPASHSVNYAWNLYPIANKALYGYNKAANKSFMSSAVPDGVKTQIEDGILALHVPAGKEIDLGDFAGTCVSNTTKCRNFSVSFLLKPQGDKNIKIFDSGMRYGRTEEWGWLFEIYSDGDFNAMVGHENSLGERGGKPASIAQWLHVGFTYDSSDCCGGQSIEVFLNGSQVTGPAAGSSPLPQDKVTRLKLGSKDNAFGFFIRDFQFLEVKLSAQDMQELDNTSFAKALQAYNVTVVEVLTASVAVPGNAGTVRVPLKRTANLDVAIPVGFNVIGDTAVAKKHFNPPADQQVAFAPGEIYTHMEVGIVDDKATPGNKTFKIAFNSPEDWVVLSGPVEVEVIVMYSTVTSGSTGTAPSVEGKMFLVFCTMLLFVRSFLVAV